MADFVNGLFVKEGKYGTKISVNVDKFIAELKAKANEKGYANIEIKSKRSGDGLYAVWDDWQPATQPNTKTPPPAGGYKAKSDIPQNDDSLPF